MSTFKNNTEGQLLNQDGEILNYRIYSDGGVKVEGANYFECFDTVAEFKYKLGIK